MMIANRTGRRLLSVVAGACLLLGLVACGAEDQVGGWSLPGTLYVCFGDNGKLGLGGDPEDASEPCCDYTIEGTFKLDGHTGSWSVSGDTLTIEASDLAKDGPGPYQLTRDDSLNCF